MFNPDKSQLAALETWYPKNNPLHLDPRHPCIKLAGEAGELLDLYGKHEYKPNWSWWNCKHCGYGDASHTLDSYKRCPYLSKVEDANILRGTYAPLVLDELGDYSYYLRILAYQKEVTFESLCQIYHSGIGNEEWYSRGSILNSLSGLSLSSSELLDRFLNDREIVGSLTDCVFYFLAILHKLDTSLEHILDLNYKKLNTESQHGWQNATVKTTT